MKKALINRAAIAALVMVPGAAFAQTPVGGIPQVPVPKSVVKQAEAQANGQFSEMRRSMVGGQIQKAWDKADDNAGVIGFNFCSSCSYKVRLREHMVTVIELPEGEVIERADAGDTKEFLVEQRQKNRLSIKPYGAGVDSNLMVFGKSGNVYPVYLRTEKFNSVNVSDLLVRIQGTVTMPEIEVPGVGVGESPHEGITVAALPKMAVPGSKHNVPLEMAANSEADEQEDFVQKIPFYPDKIRGWDDYELWGGGPHVDQLRQAIKSVFKDDYMTFIRFNDKWASVELPTAYVVVDSIDEVVNTRIDGKTYIIESTQRLITLKSGQSYLCIKYVGA